MQILAMGISAMPPAGPSGKGTTPRIVGDPAGKGADIGMIRLAGTVGGTAGTSSGMTSGGIATGITIVTTTLGTTGTGGAVGGIAGIPAKGGLAKTTAIGGAGAIWTTARTETCRSS